MARMSAILLSLVFGFQTPSFGAEADKACSQITVEQEPMDAVTPEVWAHALNNLEALRKSGFLYTVMADVLSGYDITPGSRANGNSLPITFLFSRRKTGSWKGR